MAKRSNQYPPSITLEGYTLSYRGEGVKKALIFDLYSAAFYTNDIITSTTDVIEKNVPKLLVTTILTPLLNGTLLSQIFKDALAKTYYGKLPDIQKDVEDILDVFKKVLLNATTGLNFCLYPTKVLSPSKMVFNNIPAPTLFYSKPLWKFILAAITATKLCVEKWRGFEALKFKRKTQIQTQVLFT
ncbi:MAG: chalcone isomerase family protein [Chitinophagales bacterium]